MLGGVEGVLGGGLGPLLWLPDMHMGSPDLTDGGCNGAFFWDKTCAKGLKAS